MTSSKPPSYVSNANSQEDKHKQVGLQPPDTDDGDKLSTKSRSSQGSRGDPALDALVSVAGERVRHAKCAPEFLEEVAKRGVLDILRKEKKLSAFKIIAGVEALSYFKKFLGEKDVMEEKEKNEDSREKHEDPPSPIVFAVTAWDAGRKCVDYYMTWRGKIKPRHLKGLDRRVSLLDSEFRRVARSIDKEFKRYSRASSRVLSIIPSPQETVKDEKGEASPEKKEKPNIEIKITPAEPPSDAILDRPVSATSSVISLPFLNMMRNVPLGNRMVLRVTNPDAESISSDSETVDENTPDTPSASPEAVTQSTAKIETLAVANEIPDATPVDQVRRERLEVSKHHTSRHSLRKSSESIKSAKDRHSRSSRTSKSHTREREKTSRESPHRRHASSPEDEKPNKNDSPTTKRDKSSSRKSDHDDHSSEFLIVLLDDLDKDGLSWHGLGRQVSAKNPTRAPSTQRHSPWSGPLARADGISYRYPPARPQSIDSDSSSSEDEGGWKDSPVVPPAVPLKPLMEAMGYIRPESSYYHSSPVIPGSIQYQLSVGSPQAPASAGYTSPYIYSSPHLSPSPYVPAWLHTEKTMSSPLSRPVSHVYSPLTYSSPYTTTAPF